MQIKGGSGRPTPPPLGVSLRDKDNIKTDNNLFHQNNPQKTNKTKKDAGSAEADLHSLFSLYLYGQVLRKPRLVSDIEGDDLSDQLRIHCFLVLEDHLSVFAFTEDPELSGRM